jgi:N-dimethylarginine dimethylaminohydrolase
LLHGLKRLIGLRSIIYLYFFAETIYHFNASFQIIQNSTLIYYPKGFRAIDQKSLHYQTFKITDRVDIFTRQPLIDIFVDILLFC